MTRRLWTRQLGICAIAGAAIGLCSCATIENGTTDEIYILSQPPGARVSVSFSEAFCITPCKIDAARKDDFTVSLDKEGYDSQSIDVKSRSTASATTISRDITPDYVGRVIDVQGGANLIHVPNPIIVKLDKTAPGQ